MNMLRILPKLDPMEPCIMTEDGLLVDWRASCPSDALGEGDEEIARDLSTGDYYWVCVHCRGIVRPARSDRV